MKPRKSTYLLHRWLGLLISIQLLAWSVGGFIFSVLPLDNVRGERDVGASLFAPMSEAMVGALPEAIGAQVAQLRMEHADLATISLQDRGLGPAWEVRDTDGEFVARLDALTGEPLVILSPDEARRLALRDFAHDVEALSVELIESDPPSEYRSGALPAYGVRLDHPKRPRLYIDASTGRVAARRNRSWRVFDFFWMLHTMDYGGRDNFNHLLLTVFSVLAIATSGSGLALWGWRAQSRIRRRQPRSPRASSPQQQT